MIFSSLHSCRSRRTVFKEMGTCHPTILVTERALHWTFDGVLAATFLSVIVLPSGLAFPFKTRIAVPMESIQVDTYFLVWLSVPR